MTRLNVKTAAGTVIEMDLGKQYESFHGTLTWVDGNPVVIIEATGVSAFEGQATAARVAVEIEREVTRRLKLGDPLTDAYNQLRSAP